MKVVWDRVALRNHGHLGRCANRMCSCQRQYSPPTGTEDIRHKVCDKILGDWKSRGQEQGDGTLLTNVEAGSWASGLTASVQVAETRCPAGSEGLERAAFWNQLPPAAHSPEAGAHPPGDGDPGSLSRVCH